MVKKTGTKAEIEALCRDKQSNLKKGNYKEVAEICNFLGELLTREERFEEAINEHETELEMCEKINDNLGKAIANRKIGECYCEMGDFEKAFFFQKIFLKISQEINSDIEQQRAHATIGRTFMCRAEGSPDELGDCLRKAKEAFNSSLNFAIILKDEMELSEYSLMVGRLYLNLGILSEMSGNMLSAIKYLKDARAMMKESKLQEEEFKCVSLLSSISLNIGDLESAEDLAKIAHNLAKQLKNKSAIAESLLLRASVVLESEKFIEARHFLKKILNTKTFFAENKKKTKKMLKISTKLESSLQLLKRQTDDDQQLRLLDSLADDYCSIECFYSALKYYKRMLEVAKNSQKSANSNSEKNSQNSQNSQKSISNSELAAIFVSLAQTSADLKNFSDAIRYSREELKLRDDPEQKCRTWLNIADYSDRKEGVVSAKLAEIYENAISEAEKSGKKKLLLQCLRCQQTVFRNLGDVDKIDDIEAKIRKIGPIEDEESEEESEDAVSRTSSPDTENYSSLTESDDENEDDDNGNKNSGTARRGLYKIRRNEKGETLLHTAVIGGNLKRVKQLVAAGHPINERDHCGWLPIHEAANHNFLEIASFLIEKNALLNDRGLKGCNGLTPILDAAYSGNLEMVRLLKNRGATVTCKDNDGKTVIDALMTWRQENFVDTNQTMDAETAKDFEDLIGSLQAAMIQAGMRPEQLRSGPGKGGATQRASNSKSVKKSLQNSDEFRKVRSSSPHLDTDAANIYQAAIDSMRSSDFRQRREKRKRAPSPLATIVNDDAALIRPEKFVDEDWLIEDVSTSNGPRVSRDAADIFYTSGVRQSTGKRKASGMSSKASVKTPTTRLKPSVEYDESSSMDIECIEISRPSRSGVDKSLMSDDEGDWPREATPILPFPSSPAISTVSSSISVATMPVAPPTTAQVAPPPNSFGRLRIRIENLVILVPVASGQDRTIGWLCEEAAIRYSEMKGIKPFLQLKTSDGAVLSALDLVRDVVSQSEELVGVAVSWHNPPITERYAKSCLASGVSEITNLRQALVNACETGILAVADLNISSSRAGPVFRSLQFQTNIQQLILEANPIGDSGFQILIDALPSLQNITHLDLSCTELTSVSLEALRRCLTTQTTKCLPCLSDLNLSHNDFSSEEKKFSNFSSEKNFSSNFSSEKSISNLIEIIAELPCLTSLALDDCGFDPNFLDRREIAFRSAFSKTRLRNFSFASNELEEKEFVRFFSILPFSLKSLNLSGCLSERRRSIREESLISFFDSEKFLPNSPNFESIFLSNSNFSSNFFSNFFNFLKKNSFLRTLNLSRNSSFGQPEMEILLETLGRAEVEWTSVDISGISAVDQVVPTLLRILETSIFLRELILTITDETSRESVIQCWKKFKGGSSYRYAGTPTIQLCSL